jgi:drug/metabolite transporter (DMT)-like permease
MNSLPSHTTGSHPGQFAEGAGAAQQSRCARGLPEGGGHPCRNTATGGTLDSTASSARGIAASGNGDTVARGTAASGTRDTAASLTRTAADPVGQRRGTVLMVAGGLLLGTLGVFVEEGGASPLVTVWFRCAFGLAALSAWALIAGRGRELLLAPRALAAALGAAVLMLLNWALFFAAIERTSIAVATVVFHVQPLWVIGLAAWWLREPVSRAQLGGVLVALAGLALATGLAEPGGARAAHDVRYVAGLLMCLGGSLSYAGVTLIAKQARGASGFALAWWQCLAGTLLLAWVPWLQGWPAQAAAWGWLAGLGVLHTGLAYVLLYGGMARLAAGRIAVLQFVYPVAAIGVDALVYGRALSAVQVSGVALMGWALWRVGGQGGAEEARLRKRG